MAIAMSPQKVLVVDDEDHILELARRMGVRARDVVVSDASRRTTASNAYVSGPGASRATGRRASSSGSTGASSGTPASARFTSCREVQ